MGTLAKGVVIIMFLMSAWPIGVIIDRLMAFSAARNQSRQLAPAGAGVTTAIGLFVAVPAVWMFNYFTGRVDAFDVEMGNSSSDLVDYFLKRAQARCGAGK